MEHRLALHCLKRMWTTTVWPAPTQTVSWVVPGGTGFPSAEMTSKLLSWRSCEGSFANGFANEPRSTTWHSATLGGIARGKIANERTRLVTGRHGSAWESWNSKTVVWARGFESLRLHHFLGWGLEHSTTQGRLHRRLEKGAGRSRRLGR